MPMAGRDCLSSASGGNSSPESDADISGKAEDRRIYGLAAAILNSHISGCSTQCGKDFGMEKRFNIRGSALGQNSCSRRPAAVLSRSSHRIRAFITDTPNGPVPCARIFRSPANDHPKDIAVGVECGTTRCTGVDPDGIGYLSTHDRRIESRRYIQPFDLTKCLFCPRR